MFLLTRPYGRDQNSVTERMKEGRFLLTRPYGRDLAEKWCSSYQCGFYSHAHTGVIKAEGGSSMKNFVSTHTPIRA